MVWLYSNRPAWFDNGKSAYQADFSRTFPEKLPCQFPFIGQTGSEIGKGGIVFPDIRIDMGTKGIGLLFGKSIKIFKQDVFLDQVI